MDTTIIAAIIAGLFALLAAIIPVLIKLNSKNTNKESHNETSVKVITTVSINEPLQISSDTSETETPNEDIPPIGLPTIDDSDGLTTDSVKYLRMISFKGDFVKNPDTIFEVKTRKRINEDDELL